MLLATIFLCRARSMLAKSGLSQSSQISLNEQLVQACLDLNLPNIERLLKEGADPNFLTARSEYEDTSWFNPVIKAPLDIIARAFGDDLEITAAAKLLLDHGANIHGGTSGDDFETPLHWAADFNNFELTQLLIQRGADVNIPESDLGYTPLHNACGGFGGIASTELVEFLIQQGANVNAQSHSGKTAANIVSNFPIHQYFSSKLPPLLELLTSHGADLSIIDSENQSVWLLIQNRPDLKMAVIKGLLQNDQTENNPLVHEISELLPKFGLSNVNELTLSSNAKIAINIFDKIIESHLVKLYPENLLEHQLIQASIDLNIDKMKHLLEQGADPNFISLRGNHLDSKLSALHFLSDKFYHFKKEDIFEGIKILLDHGANPNILSENGNTPLHLFAQGPSGDYYETFTYKTIVILLQHGGDLNIENNEGRTAISYLKEDTNYQFLIPINNEILKLDDIIQDDTNDSLFNINHTETLPLSQDTTPCTPYQGYVPPSIMQWLGLDTHCDTL
jgi:ankyrin repeat protein